MLQDNRSLWSIAESVRAYQIDRWGQGYFSIHENGNVMVHPDRRPERAIDLKKLIDDLQLRGIRLPILLRFNGILEDRIQEIHRVFSQAIQEYGYRGSYRHVYPIKVNQQRQVVEHVVRYGRRYGFGLEAGSKPEMLAVVAMTDANTPIICNGFKDGEFIEMAMLAQKIGRYVIPVVEKYSELPLILEYAKKVGVRPNIGLRVKLAARGSGRWESSGGYRSKFGLTVTEILQALEELKQWEMADCCKLLHFHIGSQITNIRHVKTALIEATRIYVDLVKRGAGLEFLNVGGGLGVDYDGSQTDTDSSINYTWQEYANDIIYHVQTVCDEAKVPHPSIISESGRAVAAYHSVLVFGVLGFAGPCLSQEVPRDPPQDMEPPLRDLLDTYRELSVRNLLESYHDAQSALDMVMTLFNGGHLGLERRCMAENLFWAICYRIRDLVEELEYVPPELERLDSLLSDTYFCNFSLFQSIPDSWAIKQLFPVMPIHRLEETPSRNAVISDITCDSDGKIDQFIQRRRIAKTLRLHPQDGTPYYLGAFLVGAYQEILGDLHNLFGDTNAVHVSLTEEQGIVLESTIKGDTVSEVLDYVEFEHADLVERLQNSVEDAVQKGKMDQIEAGRFLEFYETALQRYTYLKT